MNLIWTVRYLTDFLQIDQLKIIIAFQIIFLHCIDQIKSSGGVNQLADGFHIAKLIKLKYPKVYQQLTNNPIYFWNKGQAQVDQETTEFLKLLNVPMIM